MPDAVDANWILVVFHWSGENSTSARQKAGTELFRRMQQLEADGAEYHVVAHSHGGGVLEALMDAAQATEPLRGLLSWTTVGTPFLSASPAPHWSNRLRNPYRMFVALLLAIVNMTFAARLIALPFFPTSVTNAILLAVVLLQTTALSGRLSANGYLLTRIDARIEAMKRFGDRWLPLWSTGDEALTSLTVTVPKLQMKIVKPIRPAIHPHTPLRASCAGRSPSLSRRASTFSVRYSIARSPRRCAARCKATIIRSARW